MSVLEKTKERFSRQKRFIVCLQVKKMRFIV